MNKYNRLPKTWCVKNDNSPLFKKYVIDYLNSLKCGSTPYDGLILCYYGINNKGDIYADYFTYYFDDNVLSLEEFISLTTDDIPINCKILPPIWCVKNDGSQLFKDTVIKYLNSKHEFRVSGDNMNLKGTVDCYYGIDGDGRRCVDNSSYCFNHKILTLCEFIDLTTNCEEENKNCVTLTKEQLLALSKTSDKAKEMINTICPSALETKYLTLGYNVIRHEGKKMIEVKTMGIFPSQSFALNNNYKWELLVDINGNQILLPTNKC